MNNFLFYSLSTLVISILSMSTVFSADIYYSETELPQSTLRVTSIGYCPQSKVGTVQGKLLAKRAAVVNGYKKIAHAINDINNEPFIKHGTISTNSFIKGITVKQISYYRSGKAQAILEYPLVLRNTTVIKTIPNKYTIYEVEGPFVVNANEWSTLVN